jgi:quercetin dioxygenase-like cupin family protein
MVFGHPVLPAEDGVTVNAVTFTPHARTYWHRHDGGQVLIGLIGEGLVVTRSGERQAIKAGTIVHAAPGEEHWHGATSHSMMSHLAISMGGGAWLEEVAENDAVG